MAKAWAQREYCSCNDRYSRSRSWEQDSSSQVWSDTDVPLSLVAGQTGDILLAVAAPPLIGLSEVSGTLKKLKKHRRDAVGERLVSANVTDNKANSRTESRQVQVSSLIVANTCSMAKFVSSQSFDTLLGYFRVSC